MSTTKKSITISKVRFLTYMEVDLSTAYPKANGIQPHDEFQLFAIELEYINRLATIKITSDK